MGRNKNAEALHGWLAVDKPRGITSAMTVQKVRNSLNAKKVGHGGTLDPLATGVLPMAFGEATKTIRFVLDGNKKYNITIRWGENTDTDDCLGKTIGESSVRPDERKILNILSQYVGVIQQVPPDYSAVKIDGKRAYKLARAKLPVNLKARPILIKTLSLTNIPDRDHAIFSVESGKGAYMRSLARDIAESLGTKGHIVELRRTASGPFSEEEAISLDKLKELGHTAAAKELIKPIEVALDDIPALPLTEEEANRVRRGQSLTDFGKSKLKFLSDLRQGETVFATSNGKPVALAKFEEGRVCPFRVLNL